MKTTSPDFQYLNLPFEQVETQPVLAFPPYSAPSTFVQLEVKPHSEHPSLTAKFAHRNTLSQILSIPLELDAEILEAMQHNQQLGQAYPCYVETHALWNTLYLVAFNTLWTIDLDRGTSQRLDWNDPEFDGANYKHLRAQRLKLGEFHVDKDKHQRNHPWIYSSNMKWMTCATHAGIIAIKRVGEQRATTFLDETSLYTSQRAVQLRFGWNDKVLARVLGDQVEIWNFENKSLIFKHNGTSFSISDDGLAVILDGQMLRGFDLNRGVFVFHHPTPSVSRHIHVSSSNPSSIHLVHGANYWNLACPLEKLKSIHGYVSDIPSYRFATSCDDQARIMSASEVIRQFADGDDLTLHQDGVDLIFQSNTGFLRGLPYARRNFKEVQLEDEEVLPMLPTLRGGGRGFLLPLKSGQVNFYLSNSCQAQPLLDTTTLDYLKLSQGSAMKRRLQTHENDPSYRMYLNFYGYHQEVKYQHHHVCRSKDHQYMITGTSWDAVRVWNLATGKVVAQFDLPESTDILEEAVAHLHCGKSPQSLTVIMQNGSVYRVSDFLNPKLELEKIESIEGFTRLDIAWVQHQRFALVVEGYCDKDTWEIREYQNDPAPKLLDLEALTLTALPALAPGAYSEIPLAICPKGRYLLMESTKVDCDYFLPGKHRVVDLQDNGSTVSEQAVNFFTQTVSKSSSTGLFHLLTKDHEIRTFQWATSNA